MRNPLPILRFPEGNPGMVPAEAIMRGTSERRRDGMPPEREGRVARGPSQPGAATGMSQAISGTPIPRAPGLPRWQCLLVAAVLAYALLAQAADLDATPLSVDEAETGINALSILEHGVPVSEYLGQPIYENTLVRPWPESPEYEFRDTSYSDRGLAIYHGWFPLYATAASLALAGVEPDRDPAAEGVRHSVEEIRRRTAAGRLPAALFGVAFLAAVFFAARELYGPDAGWAALAAGAVLKPAVYFAGQARYYAATMALTAGCALVVTRMVRRGWWRDFLTGAGLFVLLFHTHLPSFAAAGVAFGLTVPVWVRRPGSVRKLFAFAAVVGAGVVPWVALTGFAGSVREQPPARSLLGWEEARALLRVFGPFALAAGLTLAWVAVAPRLAGWLPARCLRPFADRGRVFFFLAAWAAIGLVVFVACVPAASFYYGRLVLTVLVPGFLFGALLCAATARAAAPRFASLLAPALLTSLVAVSGQAAFGGRVEYSAPARTFEVVEHLRGLHLPPRTRIYATPNHHLVLTYYTGLPVQSVAPVRRSYLDRYDGDLLIVEAGPRHEPLTRDEIRRLLAADGPPLTDAEEGRLEQMLATCLLREQLRGRVAEIVPGPEPAPPGLDALRAYQQQKTAAAVARRLEREGNPMFKGFRLPDHGAYWQVFHYRFVNPDVRTGDRLNYAGRLKAARATVLPQGWVLHHCPAPARRPS
jgi:hypothetical protein